MLASASSVFKCAVVAVCVCLHSILSSAAVYLWEEIMVVIIKKRGEE